MLRWLPRFIQRKEVTMKNRNRTIIVDFTDENQYQKIITDGTAFVEWVVAYLLALGLQILHQHQCRGGNCFTRHSHYVRTRCGGLTIWRIQCKRCQAVFTVLPSFLLRYRSYGLTEVRKVLRDYHGGLSLENCTIGTSLSGVALYRLICSFGKASLAQVLTKAGVPLPKHVQADEKHTKCLGTKGYIPLMSAGHVIWQIDYVDSVDEAVLEASYRQFATATRQLMPTYAPHTVTHDGFKPTSNALVHIFKKASVYLLCWLHACHGFAKILEPFSKEEANRASFWLLRTLQKCHQQTSRQRISLRSHLTACLRHYKKLVPADVYIALKGWIARKKPYLYASMDFPQAHSFSYSIDHVCNHLDRKLFMMKYFHHPTARRDLFLKGFAQLHNFIPYQKFARNAHQCPAQVEGAKLPHPDWLVSLSMLTSGGYHKM
jgi:hypothetical protein